VTRALGEYTTRSIVQYSQSLMWCSGGCSSTSLNVVRGLSLKYSARKATELAPLISDSVQGRYTWPLPTGKVKVVLPSFCTGPCTKLAWLAFTTAAVFRRVTS